MMTVYTSVTLDKETHDPKIDESESRNVSETPRYPSLAVDVHTFQNLISEYNVEIGHRANLPELIKKAFLGHISKTDLTSAGNNTIGVFVSGPDTLKQSVEYTIADLGTQHFDMHEEEFEL
ncbi:hypothetical protein PHMEG_00011013 [Phytophthora megakarya]|uniref:Uncharacterized protein n=1 Tax=Phytophthora megakarya TaxID=4795 RepID=A0A225WES0_9STRA|nr:hypothetical protein PHMEG_00011013 [Phytophthora megakarya]